MSLTRSARAERERIIEVHRSAVMETFKLMLGAAMPGGTPHERQKTRWIIKGFEMATDALRRAIEETAPAIATEARRAETENTGSVHGGAGRNAALPETKAVDPYALGGGK